MKEEALRRKAAQKSENGAAFSAQGSGHDARGGNAGGSRDLSVGAATAGADMARADGEGGAERSPAVSVPAADGTKIEANGELENGANAGAGGAGQNDEKPAKRRKFFSASNIAKIAVFAALATILQLLRIPLPFMFPSFLELNLADIPALIGSFALGPVAGSIIVVVKLLLKLLIQGTGSAFVGDLSDLFCGLMLVVPAGIIYKYHRTFKGALVALAAGTLCSVGVSLITNRFIIIPAYVQVYGFEMIIGMVNSLFPAITQENFYAYYLPLSCLPFNLLRCLIASAVTLLSYKRISRFLNKF